MANVKGDGEGLVQGQTAIPGDSLGTATAAPNSHSAPSTEPGPNQDLLSTGTCICCVCCTSLRSYSQWPNAAATPARLQESSADQIIKSMNELQEYPSQRALLPRCCLSSALHLCWPGCHSFQHLLAPPAVLAELGCPSQPLQPVVSALGAPRVWLWRCQPFVRSVPARGARGFSANPPATGFVPPQQCGH